MSFWEDGKGYLDGQRLTDCMKSKLGFLEFLLLSVDSLNFYLMITYWVS